MQCFATEMGGSSFTRCIHCHNPRGIRAGQPKIDKGVVEEFSKQYEAVDTLLNMIQEHLLLRDRWSMNILFGSQVWNRNMDESLIWWFFCGAFIVVDQTYSQSTSLFWCRNNYLTKEIISGIIQSIPPQTTNDKIYGLTLVVFIAATWTKLIVFFIILCLQAHTSQRRWLQIALIADFSLESRAGRCRVVLFTSTKPPKTA